VLRSGGNFSGHRVDVRPLLLTDESFCQVRRPRDSDNERVHLQVEPEKVYNYETTYGGSRGLKQTLSCNRISLDHAKRSFFRAANGIFGKIGRIASEDVVIQLLSRNASLCYCIA